MPTFTSNFGLSKPLVNNATDQDLWGSELNGDLDELDVLLKTALNWTSSTQALDFNVVIPTAGSASTNSAKILYQIDSTLNNVTASLPASAGASGLTVAFRRIIAGGNVVTIQANGAELINGSNTLLLASRWDYAVLACDGTGWSILAQTGTPLNSPAFTGIPTAPTAALNTATTQLATTAFANPQNLLGVNGYNQLPSGLILQWGVTTGIVPGNTFTGTFPLAFPSTCYSFVVSGTNSASAGPVAGNFISTTQFTVKNQSAQNQAFYWHAVGG